MTIASIRDRTVYRVQVLERAFDILDALADHASELALSKLSQTLHLHRSTVHRLVVVLESSRYVERSGASGKYRLRSKLVELGMKVVARLDLPGLAKPFLEQFVRETGETAHMGTLREGGGRVHHERGKLAHPPYARYGGTTNPGALLLSRKISPGFSFK